MLEWSFQQNVPQSGQAETSPFAAPAAAAEGLSAEGPWAMAHGAQESPSVPPTAGAAPRTTPADSAHVGAAAPFTPQMASLFGHFADGQSRRRAGQSVPASIRSRVESVTGADLSAVRLHVGPEATTAGANLGASALALGTDVYFRTEEFRPGTTDGDWLIAHELAHTVQQENVGEVSPQAKHELGPVYDEAEAEADQVADHALQPNSPRRSVRRLVKPRIQRFSPDGHRRAGAAGLRGTFTPEEIGLIYVSNWERDFSQGPAETADVVIAWKLVKESAAQNNGKPDPSLATLFKAKAWAVLDMNTEALSETMGGYQPWEHMDHPGKKEAKKAEKRRAGQYMEMPAYLEENRAHIMNLLVQAVQLYWKAAGRPDHPSNSWKYDSGPAATTGPKNVPQPSLPRDVIAREATAQARQPGDASTPLELGRDGWPLLANAADPLGRAMHCIEDFFSHSNWLELARRVKQGQAIQGHELQTSKFPLASKCHALGHKLVALADALLKDFALLLKVFGRSTPHMPNAIQQLALGLDLAPMSNDAWFPATEVLDVASSATLLGADVRGGILSMESILCNREVLNKIRNKGQLLITEGDRESNADDHGKQAKDQPEHGKDFETAHALAVHANQLIVAPLKRAMQAQDSEQGARILAEQLAMTCKVLAPPSADHPLMNVLK